MAALSMTTWKDLIDHLIDWTGSNPGGDATRDARRASLSALRELGSMARWSYYYQRGRMNSVAPYSTGTAAYDHTGGAFERMLTLTSGTWPAWASFGSLVIANVIYEVADRKSDTVVTLTSASNPGDDLASGTGYAIYRDTFPLPTDCLAIDMMVLVNYAWVMGSEHPTSWLQRQQIYRGQALPRVYCIRGDPNYIGTMAVSFFPAPDAAYNFDYIYQRRPRPLLIDEYAAGSVTTSSGSATLTGVGTSWTSRMVGSVARVSSSQSLSPTGLSGSNPYRFERIITAVGSPTSITLDDSVDEAYTRVKYSISDPVDIEEGAMLTALLRGCEYQMAVARHMKDRQEEETAWLRSLIQAREADSRNFSEDHAGARHPFPYRLANFPAGPDVS